MNYIVKNTLPEFMNKVMSDPERKADLSSRTIRTSPTWDANADFNKAVSLQQGGWSERPNLSKLASGIETKGTAEIVKATTTYDVQGAYVDVATYLEGVPECMVDFSDEVDRRVVRVAFNLSTSCNLTTKAFHNRGAVVLAVTRKLIEAGYSVELVGFQFVQSSAKRQRKGIYLQQVVIKEAEDVIDEDAIAFWCCHPAALRRLGFSAKESMAEEVREYFGFVRGGGYGSPRCAHTNSKVLEALAADCIIDVKSDEFEMAIREYEHAIEHLNNNIN